MSPASEITECARKRELMLQLADVLARLQSLLTAEKEAVERCDRAGMDGFEPEIERALEAKDELLGALRRHLEEHHC